MDQNNLLITVRPVSKTYDGTCVLSLENEISLEDGEQASKAMIKSKK